MSILINNFCAVKVKNLFELNQQIDFYTLLKILEKQITPLHTKKTNTANKNENDAHR